jgi:hypothetical protein
VLCSSPPQRATALWYNLDYRIATAKGINTLQKNGEETETKLACKMRFIDAAIIEP